MKRPASRFLLGIILSFFCFSFTSHKFYVSVSELEYDTNKKRMELSVKFIGHDLEHALEKAGVPNLFLGTDKEHAEANSYLEKYINKNIKVLADSNYVKFTIIGKEVANDDFIFCYLKSDTLANPKTLNLTNSLLIEVFPDQSNILYYKNGSDHFDFRFNKQKTSIKKPLK